jgi:hypothetical protein
VPPAAASRIALVLFDDDDEVFRFAAFKAPEKSIL